MNHPLTPWQYFGLSLLYTAVPVVGFIFMIINSFSANVNLKNYTRSYWISYLLGLIIVAIAVVLVVCGVVDPSAFQQ